MPWLINWMWYMRSRPIGNKKIRARSPTSIYTMKSPTTLSLLVLILTVKTTPIIKQDTISTTKDTIYAKKYLKIKKTLLIIIFANADRQPRTVMVISLHTMVTCWTMNRTYWSVYMALPAVFLMVEDITLWNYVTMLYARWSWWNLK